MFCMKPSYIISMNPKCVRPYDFLNTTIHSFTRRLILMWRNSQDLKQRIACSMIPYDLIYSATFISEKQLKFLKNI